MAKKLSKELLDAINDPDVREELGLVKKDDKELEKLFGPIDITDDMTTAEVVRIMNDRSKAQMKYVQKLSGKGAEEAKRIMKEQKEEAESAAVDKFLEAHPWVSANTELLKTMTPLYNTTGDLDKALAQACKIHDLDPDTGKEPEEKKEEKPAKQTQLKSDALHKEKPAEKGEGEVVEKKSLKEIISEHSNALAAEGKNPFREGQSE